MRREFDLDRRDERETLIKPCGKEAERNDRQEQR